MKKKLEAELISIAHRILQLKSKSDVRELHLQTQKLYEKLSVLLFLEENFEEVKPTIGKLDVEEKLKLTIDYVIEKSIEPIQIEEEKLIETIELVEAKPIEPIKIEEEKLIETIHFKEEIKNNFSLENGKIEENTIVTPPIIEVKEIIEEVPQKTTITISFEDLFEDFPKEPLFERLSNIDNKTVVKEEPVSILEQEIFKKEPLKATNLNDKLNKNLNLNDKITFERELFDGSTTDFNRVLSQITTFNTYFEAYNFITEIVKPDYNNWKGKEEYEERFMEFVEAKFN